MLFLFCEFLDQETMYDTYTKQKIKWRKDPIPFTGGVRYSKYFRNPKTIQEKRKYSECKELTNELKIKYRNIKLSRPKRSISRLPDSYDDIYRSNALSKSWKNQRKRKRQWKPKEA